MTSLGPEVDDKCNLPNKNALEPQRDYILKNHSRYLSETIIAEAHSQSEPQLIESFKMLGNELISNHLHEITATTEFNKVYSVQKN